MTAIIYYGVGNLFSLKSSFAAIGAETVVTSDPDTLRQAEKLVLPQLYQPQALIPEFIGNGFHTSGFPRSCIPI